jgi:hypothetical protein
VPTPPLALSPSFEPSIRADAVTAPHAVAWARRRTLRVAVGAAGSGDQRGAMRKFRRRARRRRWRYASGGTP